MLLSNHDQNKSEAEQALAIAKAALEKVEQTVSVLQKRTDEYTGKIMPVENANFMGQRHDVQFYTNSSTYYSNSYQSVASRARKHANELKAKCDEAHQHNLAALANNKKLREKVEVFMDAIGMPRSYAVKEYKTRRSNGEYVKYDAGYLSDISRHIIVDDGYEMAMKEYTSFLGTIAAWEKEKEQEEKKLEAEREKKEKQVLAEKQLGVLLLKYGLPYESNWKEVLECLLTKDKYLRLGHFLFKNYNDSIDGHEQADYGLSQFQVESEQDREIAKDIQNCIDNWDGDGRTFCDTTWSYDEIFKLVEPGLFKDYLLCSEHIN